MSNGVRYNTTIAVNGVNNTGAMFGQVGGSLDRLNTKLTRIQRSFQRAATTATSAGSAMMIGFTAPVAAAARGVVDTMRTYEKASAQLAATMGTDVSKIAAFQKQAEELAGKTVFSESQVLGAQREAAMAGFTDREVIDITPQVLNFATMSGMEIPKAAMMGTDILRGFGAPVERIEGLLDRIAFASTKANQDAEQFARGLTRFAPIARQMNMSMSESIAYLSELADGGFKAAEGGNALRTIMLRLAAPTKQAREAVAALGIDLADFNAGSASASGVISALVQSGVAGAAELERLKPRIAKALTIEPPKGMTREQSIIDILMQGLGLDGADGAALSEALGNYLSQAAAGIDHKGLLAEVNNRISEQGLDPLPFVNALFGKQRAAQGAVLLSSVESITERLAAIEAKSAGAAAKMSMTMMESIDSQLQLLTSAKEVFQRAVWDSGFGEFFTGVANSITRLFLVAAELPKPILKAASGFAGFAAAGGIATLALGGFLRIAAFSLVPFGAMAKAMAAITARTVALGSSLISLKALRVLASPVGLLAVAVGGLGAKLYAVVKDSPLVGKSLSALGSNFRDMWGGIGSGDGKKVSEAIKQTGRTLRILRYEVKQVARAWMDSTPAGRRLKDILGSLSKIVSGVWNALRNVGSAVSGLFSGIAQGLGITGDLGASVDGVSEKTQGFVAWFLRAVAALTNVAEKSAGLRATFTRLGRGIGVVIDTAITPFVTAFKALGDMLDKLFNSAAWGKFEALLGVETGGTVQAIDNVTSSIKALAQSFLALGVASMALFGVKRTLRGLSGIAGLFGMGSKGKGAVGAAAPTAKARAAFGFAAPTMKDTKAGGGFLSKLAKFAPALNGGLLALSVYEKEQRDAVRRLELIGQGMTPRQAAGQVMRETHERFEAGPVAKAMRTLAQPLHDLGQRVNASLGIAEGDSMAAILKRTFSLSPKPQPTGPLTPAQIKGINDAHKITNLPRVRSALQHTEMASGGAGLFSGLKAQAQAATAAREAETRLSELVASASSFSAKLSDVGLPDAKLPEGLQGGPLVGHVGVAPVLTSPVQPAAPQLDVLPLAGRLEMPAVSDTARLSSPESRKTEALLQEVRDLLADGGVTAELKGEADVTVNVRSQDGLYVGGVSRSKGDVAAKLNTGRSRLAPF